MKQIFIVIFVVLISSCSLIGRVGSCSIASEREGWTKIEKPQGIEADTSIFSKEYIIWFQRPEGLVKSCRRSVSDRCLEIGETYKKIDDKWQFQEQTDFVVCT